MRMRVKSQKFVLADNWEIAMNLIKTTRKRYE